MSSIGMHASSSTHPHNVQTGHTTIPFLRVPKPGFGKSKDNKDKNKQKAKSGGENGQDEWYIPYNGPYEPAPSTTTKVREREKKERDKVDSHHDSHNTHASTTSGPSSRGVSSQPVHQPRKTTHRRSTISPSSPTSSQQHHTALQEYQRSQSPRTSYQSNRNSITVTPLGAADYPSPTRITSYINLDAAGGVGEFPMPSTRPFRNMEMQTGYGDNRLSRLSVGTAAAAAAGNRPVSAGEASLVTIREEKRDNSGGVGGAGRDPRPRTLSQRSSLASFFDKRYGLFRKLSKSGYPSPSSSSSSPSVLSSWVAAERFGRASNSISEDPQLPPPRPPRLHPSRPHSRPQSAQLQQESQAQPQEQQRPVTASSTLTSSAVVRSPKTKPNLRIDPPPPPPSSSSLALGEGDGDDGGKEDRRDERGDQQQQSSDILLVPRSPKPESETGTRSASMYSQPSPFVPVTQTQGVEQDRGNLQAQEHDGVPSDSQPPPTSSISLSSSSPPPPLSPPPPPPLVRLTPPPIEVPNAPLSASTTSSLSIIPLASPSSYSHSRSNSRESASVPLPSLTACGPRTSYNNNDNNNNINSNNNNNYGNIDVNMMDIIDAESQVESYYDMLITSSSLSLRTANTVNRNNSIENDTHVGLTPRTAHKAQSNSKLGSRIVGGGEGGGGMSSTRQSNDENDKDAEKQHPYARAGVIFPSDPATTDGLTTELEPLPPLLLDSDPNTNQQGGGGDATAAPAVVVEPRIRSSPKPRSRFSIGTLRSASSTPDLRGQGGKKEKWLSTNLIAIFLPRPKFKFKANKEKGKDKERETEEKKEKKNNGKEKFLNKRFSRSLVDLKVHHRDVSSARHPPPPPDNNMAEFGVQRQEKEPRRSYAYDDLSLLSLDRVLEERDRLEKDRAKWQAQATKSIGNKQARTVSRSRAKSLTQAGRGKARLFGHHHTTRAQQSNIDYLAARACLGDQDAIPLVINQDRQGVINAGRRLIPPQSHQQRQQHERKQSGSSGAATTSAGGRSSNAFSAQSHVPLGSVSADNHHHKRTGSWTRSAVRVVKSLPQLCGPLDYKEDTGVQQQHRDPGPRVENALKNDDGEMKVVRVDEPPTTVSAAMLSPAPASDVDNRKSSPPPSSGSYVALGIALSSPTESQGPETAAFAYRDHPYTIGADRIDNIKRKNSSSTRPSPPVIRLPDHPYAQGGLSESSTQRDYVGPHPATATAMTKELMANLGLSEVSARHRLPPQVTLAQVQQSLSRQSSSSQHSHSPSSSRPSSQQLQKQQHRSQHLYVKVDDNRNSYQDLQPYVRADSTVAPSDRLWVTYSPGTVKEVMPSEVSQYSPYASDQEDATQPSAGTDFFLQRYQRMSTVYQDTASMTQDLGNAMYDSAQDSRRSVDSGIGISEEHQQEGLAHTRGVLDLPETIVESQEQSPALQFTPPPRTISAATSSSSQLNTPLKQTGPTSHFGRPRKLPSRPSPPENHSPFIGFANPFPRTSSIEHSSYGTSPPTSPTVPRVGSPDNLEPFQGLFYNPPEGSESDSLPSGSPQLENIPDPDDDPSQLLEAVNWTGYPSRRLGSGLTTLINDMELDQIALEQQRERERSGSVRSTNTQSQRPSTSDSLSTSTSRGGSSSGRITTEAGPLHFVLDRMPLQDPPSYIPRPDRISTFYPTTPIPEDVEFSRASSPFEGTVEDETVQLPAGSANQTTPVPILPPQHNQQVVYVNYPPLESLSPGTLGPDGSRESYYTTDTQLSTLSDFPVPPDRIAPVS